MNTATPPPPGRSEKENESGFTMIEILVAMAVMLIVGAVVLAAITTIGKQVRLAASASTTQTDLTSAVTGLNRDITRSTMAVTAEPTVMETRGWVDGACRDYEWELDTDGNLWRTVWTLDGDICPALGETPTVLDTEGPTLEASGVQNTAVMFTYYNDSGFNLANQPDPTTISSIARIAYMVTVGIPGHDEATRINSSAVLVHGEPRI